MTNQEQLKFRRPARCIAVIVAVVMLTITGYSHATTFIYANSHSSTNNQRLYKIDATTGAVVNTCLLQKGFGRGIVVMNNLAYYTTATSNQVFKADIITCADLGPLFSVSGASGLSTMAFDGTNFWIGDYSVTNQAYYYSPAGTLIKTIHLANCAGNCDGLEFFSGKLISNRGDATSPYDIYDTTGNLLTPSFITTNLSATGIAFDGNDFFVSDIFNQKLRVYDGTGAFVRTIIITGLLAGANEIEDLSFDYSLRPDLATGEGVLKVCKVAGPGVAVGTLFTFGAGSSSFTVPAGPAPGGTCVIGPRLPVGTNVTVAEVVPAGDTVSSITIVPPGQLVGTPNLATGSVNLTIGSGVTEVTFTNKRTGYLEICKMGDVKGNATFTVEPGALGPFVVPAGACSPAIEVVAGSVSIHEVSMTNGTMNGCSTIPASQQGTCDPTNAQTSTVSVSPGDVSSQTIAIITNKPALIGTPTRRDGADTGPVSTPLLPPGAAVPHRRGSLPGDGRAPAKADAQAALRLALET
jgi:hypothetical protein